jgi:uncharacterized protein (DUF58 family)
MEGPHTPLYRRFLIAAALVVGFLGLVLQARGLLALGFALAILVVLARLQSSRRLHGLRARRDAHSNAFEGDQISITLVLDNHGWGSVELVELVDSFGPGIADKQVVLEPGPLRGRRRRRLAYRAFCSKGYGIYGVGPLRLAVADPLGLFQRRRVFPEIEMFAVFPRVHAVGGLAPLGARPSLTPQPISSASAAGGAVYLGVRDYRPGDELRRIHWPATARRGQPVVKEHEVDLMPYFTLFPDLNRANRAGTGRKSTLEYVVRIAGSLLWQATQRGETVQLIGEGARSVLVPPGRGELHLTLGLYELIRARLDGELPLLDVVDQHRSRLPRGSTAAVLFGSIRIDATRLEELLGTLVAAQVRPLLIFVNGDSFTAVERLALSATEVAERCQRLRAFLHRHGVPGAILGEGDDLAQVLPRPDLLEASA